MSPSGGKKEVLRMNFYLDYQAVQRTTIVGDDGEGTIILPGPKEEQRLIQEKKLERLNRQEMLQEIGSGKLIILSKKNFLENLTPEDILWLEMGGGSDKFVLAALRKKAKVNQIPTFRFKTLRTPGPSNEMHFRLRETALSHPRSFYPIKEKEEDLIRLRILHRVRQMIMETIRIPMDLRIQGILRDLELLLPEGDLESELREKYAINFLLQITLARFQKLREAVQQIENLTDNKEITKITRAISKILTQEEEQKISNPLYHEALLVEKQIFKQIKEILPHIPIYQKFLKDLKGAGPRIAAGIIAEIGDIRRFPSPASLCKYAGWGFVLGKEGNWEIQKKKRKPFETTEDPSASTPGNLFLKTSIYLLIESFIKHKTPYWKNLYEGYKKRLREKHPKPVPIPLSSGKTRYDWSDKHIHLTAILKTGTRFLWVLWKEWMRLEAPEIYKRWKNK